MNKLMVPELVRVISDQFNERDQQTPWMWSIDNQSFKEDPVNRP